jgi:hypothetical protein
MGSRKSIVGLVIGFLGCALTGYALFSIFASAGCAASFDASCASDVFSTVWMLPVGIVAAMVGMFLGGGMLVFSGLFMAIGAGALAIGILGLMPNMPVFPILFGGMFLLGGLVPFFLRIMMKRQAAAKQVMAAELMQSGVKGVGTIVGVTDTGITINNNPRITIRMRIDPLDGSAAVERLKTVTVSRVQIPQAGSRYPAWFDRNDPDKWMYGTDMDASAASAEVKDMFARAAAPPPTPAGARFGGDGAVAAAAGGDDSPVEELASLTELWKSGALTDTEFAAAKARLLAKIGH